MSPAACARVYSPPMAARVLHRWLIWETILVVLGLSLLLASVLASSPSFTDTVYTPDGEAPRQITLPLDEGSKGAGGLLRFSLHLGATHHTVYRLTPDDCIEWLNINDRKVDGGDFCDLEGRTMDLAPYLHEGENTVLLQLKDNGGQLKFRMTPAMGDPLRTLQFCTLLILSISAAVAILATVGLSRHRITLAVIVGAGVILRLVYMLLTPHETRSYDWDGHIEYILFMAKNFAVPPSSGGWEFYQPPLYYMLTGAWVWLVNAAQLHQSLVFGGLQFLSFALSVACLLGTLWIMTQVFGKSRRHWPAYVFLSLFVVFPGIVYFSSRLSNDVLSLTLGIFWLGFLLRWWKSDATGDWYSAATLLGFGLLTKSTFLPLVGAQALCLVLKPGTDIREKIRKGVLCTIIVAAMTGWFYVERFVMEKQANIVGNIGGLNGALMVQNTFPHVSFFNPIEIIRHPFNNPWGDDERRQYFWEYLYKSGFIGEWRFEHIAVPVMIAETLGMIFLAFALAGVAAELRSRDRLKHLPLLLTLAALLGGLFTYRLQHPYGCNQDFRFIPLVIIPIAFYGARGMELLADAVARRRKKRR